MAEVLQKLSVKRFSATSCNRLGTPREAWETALPPVRGQPAERFRLAEVEQRSVLESNSALPVTVIGVDELDSGGQLARLHRHVDMVIFIAWRIR